MKSKKKSIYYIKKYLGIFFILAAGLFVVGNGALISSPVTVHAETAPQAENADGAAMTGSDTESEESRFLLFFFAGILLLIAVVAAVVTVIVSGSSAVIVEEDEE